MVIAKDIHSALVIGDTHHRIQQYDTTARSWTILGNYPGTLYGITFDHANACYLVMSKGIVELATNQIYLPDSSLGSPINFHKAWHRQPTYHMDAEDDLWVSFRYGEWGGDLFVFNTRLKHFLPLEMNGFSIELNPIQSISSNGEDILVSTGMDHLSTTRGSIIKLKNYKVNVVFDSSPFSDAHRKDSSSEGEYIGPVAFNTFDHCIYFYSQHGFIGVTQGRICPPLKNGKR
jgi:hypothetical protein